MGAQSFKTIQLVKGTVETAYRQANEEARNNNGHQDGYSGDIQTVSGYHKVRDYPRFGSKKFTDWLDERVENLDKNHCEYIEITGSQLIKLKETNGLKGKKGYRAFLFYGMGAS